MSSNLDEFLNSEHPQQTLLKLSLMYFSIEMIVSEFSFSEVITAMAVLRPLDLDSAWNIDYLLA